MTHYAKDFYLFLCILCLYADFEIQISEIWGNILNGDNSKGMKFGMLMKTVFLS